jgi:hypothetical protein
MTPDEREKMDELCKADSDRKEPENLRSACSRIERSPRTQARTHPPEAQDQVRLAMPADPLSDKSLQQSRRFCKGVRHTSFTQLVPLIVLRTTAVLTCEGHSESYSHCSRATRALPSCRGQSVRRRDGAMEFLVPHRLQAPALLRPPFQPGRMQM